MAIYENDRIAHRGLFPDMSASLPVARSSLSFWHRTTRGFEHLNSNASTPVPSRTKFLIIGSGLSGAWTAFSLINEHSVNAADIVILEAREAVSGATGRNAGQLLPDTFRGFQRYVQVFGVDTALKIMDLEKRGSIEIQKIVQQNEVPCDIHLTTTLDICVRPESAEYESRSLQEFKAAGGDTSSIRVYDVAEARTRTGVPDAIMAFEWPAGSIHPAKLTHWLLSAAIKRGAKLWTHCPGTRVSKTQVNTWAVHTLRGIIEAEKVIHCTNGYASSLLPQLRKFVQPYKVQAQSVVPTQKHSGNQVLGKTMCLRYGMRDFYTLAQRQADAVFILGMSRTNGTRPPILSNEDVSVDPEIVQRALEALKVMVPEEDRRQHRHGEGPDHAWAGIIGVTDDGLPLVGAIEGLPNQYVCAGFNGHGMVWIPTCAPAVATVLMDGDWNSTDLPDCFRYSARRVHDPRSNL